MSRLDTGWKVLLALPIIALSGCVKDVAGADCPTEGFFAVPGDCTRFYRCVRSSAGPFQVLQSNSIIVDSIIVENSKIVDDLAATKDFYLIKIHNSRNSKIVELFFGEVARNLVFFQLFLPLFSARMSCIHIPSLHVLFSQIDNLMFSIFDISQFL